MSEEEASTMYKCSVRWYHAALHKWDTDVASSQCRRWSWTRWWTGSKNPVDPIMTAYADRTFGQVVSVEDYVLNEFEMMGNYVPSSPCIFCFHFLSPVSCWDQFWTSFLKGGAGQPSEVNLHQKKLFQRSRQPRSVGLGLHESDCWSRPKHVSTYIINLECQGGGEKNCTQVVLKIIIHALVQAAATTLVTICASFSRVSLEEELDHSRTQGWRHKPRQEVLTWKGIIRIFWEHYL